MADIMTGCGHEITDEARSLSLPVLFPPKSMDLASQMAEPYPGPMGMETWLTASIILDVFPPPW
jgi:hypothetical protein